MGGWIKLYDKMLSWEWYGNTNVVRVFLHCLLKANYQPKIWRGIEIERGQFITSIADMSKELGLTPKQVRGAIEKLKTSNNLAIKGANKFSVITVCSYDCYQTFSEDGGQTKGQATRQAKGQTKVTQKGNNYIYTDNTDNTKRQNNKNTTPKGDSVKSPAFDFKGVLISQYGVPETIADTWLEVRRKRRAVNSELALNAIVREAEKAGISVTEAVRLAAENSWQSFQASYVKPQYKPQGGGDDNMLDLAAEVKRIKAIRDNKQNNNLQQQL